MEAVTVAKPVIKVVAIFGSLRKGFYHISLLRTALEVTKESVNGIEMENIDISPLPTQHQYRGPMKNAIDWAYRPPNVWADKTAAIVSAAGSSGGRWSQNHLRQVDLYFINKPSFILNLIQPPAKFDSDGNLIDPASRQRIKEVVLPLQAFTLQLKGQC
ncbi:hypothetical protein DITRI_Ditri09bG0058500 [Diplodiscus trichospermus]